MTEELGEKEGSQLKVILKPVARIILNSITSILYYCGLVDVISFIRRIVFKRCRILVLAYHSIGIDRGRDKYQINPVLLDRQLGYLNLRYKVIPLLDLVDILKSGKGLRHDYVALTFDDGLKNNFSEALPILKKYNFNATFFITMDNIGKKDYLGWDEILLLKREGFELGSHAIKHLPLPGLPYNQAREQIFSSKLLLEERLGSPVKYLAYPFGSFDKNIINLAKAAGFEAAFSTVSQSCDPDLSDTFCLERKEIYNQPLHSFAVKIEGLFEKHRFQVFSEK